MGDETIEADANNPLFQHEYGHYIQSQSMGLAYYSRIGIPSARSDRNTHNFHPVEQDENRRAFLYFNKHVGNFYVKEEDAYKGTGWDFWYNPLDVDGSNNRNQYVDYYNSESVVTLSKLKVSAKSSDPISWLFVQAPIYKGL